MAKEKPTTKICKYCKSEIAYDAKICPNCRKKQGGKKLFIVIAIVIVLLLIVVSGGDDQGNTGTVSTAESQTEKVSETSAQPEETEENSEFYQKYGFHAEEIYAQLQENEVTPYTLTDKARQFLRDHEELFFEHAGQSIDSNLIDYGIEAKHIAKNQEKYGDKLMSLPEVQIVQISETNLSSVGEAYATEINVIDESGQQYYIYYMGELDDMFENDVISVVGLPLGNSSFDNTDGGSTLVVVMAACEITKLY